MTDLSEEARKILEEGAQAALPGREVGDANWAALTAKIAAGAPTPIATTTAAPTLAKVGALGKLGKIVVAGALLLGGVAAGVVALGPGDQRERTPPDEVFERASEATPIEPAPAVIAEADPAPTRDADAPIAPLVEPAALDGSAPTVGAHDVDLPERTGAETPPPRPRRRADAVVDVDDVDALAEEERLLSAARRELKRSPSEALRKLDAYDARFADGALAQEAAATRILALCALDRREEGDRLAADFARRWPDAPALSRVRSACLESKTP